MPAAVRRLNDRLENLGKLARLVLLQACSLEQNSLGPHLVGLPSRLERPMCLGRVHYPLRCTHLV